MDTTCVPVLVGFRQFWSEGVVDNDVSPVLVVILRMQLTNW